MKKRASFISCLLCVSSFFMASAVQANNSVSIKKEGSKRCVYTNSLPDHQTGNFPNRGNPHRIREQQSKLCVTLTPQKYAKATFVKGATGVAVNGIQFRPATAEYYDRRSKRGFSRRGNKNWSVDIFGTRGRFGLDFNNAHVGANGLYHYHGIANSLTTTSKSSLIGYAADGFEIHYIGSKAKSAYQLKKGNRPSGPGGRFDGSYNEDYQFIATKGKLDQCNGGQLNGQFVYFVTNSYPFVGRCLWGEVSRDFSSRRN